MSKVKVAIIGCGPRGLAALENLFLELSKLESPVLDKVFLFDSSQFLGAGKAWDLEQAPTNLINISDHALQNLKGREKFDYKHIQIPSFPSYSDWCSSNSKALTNNTGKDLYPPRQQMGSYLHERFLSIYRVLRTNKLISLNPDLVKRVSLNDNFVQIDTANGNHKVAECLLTVGHQYTSDSEETKEWKRHASNSKALYIDHPYEYDIYNADFENEVLAIKGFGLSMIDICGMLTAGKHGSFQKKTNTYLLEYVAKTKAIPKIIPFSLDGLPVVPKPHGREVDSLFEPSIQQLNSFDLSIRNHLANANSINNIEFLLDEFSWTAAEIIFGIKERVRTSDLDEDELARLIKKWLRDNSLDHSCFLDQSLPVKEYMIATTEMAMGNIDFSLDYALNQVWRQLQPGMYRLFAHCDLKDHVLFEIIKLDEASKRYSYGPPVESILELIALVDAKILDLRFIDEPEINLVNEGWELQKNGNSIRVNTMINSILAPPDINKINTPIFKSLKSDGLAEEVDLGLGIRTKSDGTLISKSKDLNIPIAVLGRNAKGSILGADAILECFSPEIQVWAKQVVARIDESKNK